MGSRLLSGGPLRRFAVIVTLAGWLYIINGALVLLSLRSSLPGIALSGQLGTLVLGVGLGALGVGLLKRETWGRWFALGPSFLGWTIGALFALGMLALLIWFFANSSSLGGFAGFIGFLLVFMTVLSTVGVVINFKLYWHLVSEDGKDEFGAPESDSFVTVMQSAGVWIVASVLSLMISGSGSLVGGAVLASVLRPSREDVAAQVDERELTRQIERERARALEPATRRAQEEIQAMQRRAAENAVVQYGAPAAAAASESTNYSVQSASAPETPAGSPTSTEEKQIDMKKILKCRDGAGAVQFTQGYCPPGTKEIAAPGSN
jgi:hypothetical protein